MTIPDESVERFRSAAVAAVESLRHELLIARSQPNNNGFIAVFEQVFVPSLRETFVDIARTEFDRLGREYVRGVVLASFDAIWEKR